MSKSENDLLDSLLDSLSDDQEMEKKIGEFARNKERMRRIQRARETSEQFQQTYSRQAQNARQNGQSPASSNETSQAASNQEADIPAFLQNNASNIEQTRVDHTRIQNPIHPGVNQDNIEQTRVDHTRVGTPIQPDNLEQTRVMNGNPTPASGQDELEQTRVMNGTPGAMDHTRADFGSMPDQTRIHQPGQADFGNDTQATRPIHDFASMAQNHQGPVGGYPNGGPAAISSQAQTQTFNAQNLQGQPQNPAYHTHTYAPYDVPDLTGRVDLSGYQPQSGDTRRMPNQDAGSTRVFDSTKAPNPNGAGGGTVRMNQDEIRKFSEQDEPLLHREYLKNEDDTDEYDESLIRKEPSYKRERSYERRRRNKRSPWKTYAVVCGVVLAIVLVGVGGMTIKNIIDSKVSGVQNNEQFQKLFDWVSNYGSYDESERKKILDFRTVYEKLGDENKKKINDTLVALTGKTFDELLVAADTEKPDASNENVANAEKKAKLKDQIATIDNDIANLTTQLNETTSRINKAESDYNNKNNEYVNAQNNITAIQNEVDSYNLQLQSLPSDSSLQDQILSLQNQLEDLILSGGGKDDDEDDDHHGSSQQPSLPSVTREELQAQIFDLQSQQRENEQKRNELNNSLTDAQSRLTQAQDKLPGLKTEVDTLYNNWQNIIHDADPYQQKIVEKNNEKTELQNELDSIQ